MRTRPRAAAALAPAALQFVPVASSEETIMPLEKLTPVLFVEEIENRLPFRVDRPGLHRTMEVPGGKGQDREALGRPQPGKGSAAATRGREASSSLERARERSSPGCTPQGDERIHCMSFSSGRGRAK